MVTGIDYIRHIYKVDRVLKSYTIYELQSVSQRQKNTRPLLSHILRIEPFRGKSNATGIEELLRLREPSRWAEKSLTGLRATIKSRVFRGDQNNGLKNLLLIQLSESRDLVVIDYFRGFYPHNPQVLNDLILTHKFYL